MEIRDFGDVRDRKVTDEGGAFPVQIVKLGLHSLEAFLSISLFLIKLTHNISQSPFLFLVFISSKLQRSSLIV